jgi:hypothetical protein
LLTVPLGCEDFTAKVVAPPVHTGAFAHEKLPGLVALLPLTVITLPEHELFTVTIKVLPLHPFGNVDVTLSFSLMQLHCGSVLPAAQVTL